MSKAALLDSISPGYRALAAAVTAAGLSPAEVAAAPGAIKDKIESAVAAAKSGDAITAAIESATAELNSRLAQATAELERVTAGAAAHSAALAAVGIKPAPATAGAALSQADIESAIRDRVSILAQEQLAKFHLSAPVPVGVPASPAAPAAAAPKLTGLARVVAAFRAQREASAAQAD